MPGCVIAAPAEAIYLHADSFQAECRGAIGRIKSGAPQRERGSQILTGMHSHAA
jgi:hypothetical protein